MRQLRVIPSAGAAFLAGLAVLLLPPGARAQKGHAIAGNQILINTSSHWRVWEVSGGALDIAPDGSVRPGFMRKDINAALDAERFSAVGQGGVATALNQQEARNLIDGDSGTTWGPGPDSPLGDWGVELNLGRVVVAQKIVVRFAEEGQGDPFLQFRVLVWRHAPPEEQAKIRDYTLQGTDIPKFWEVGRTTKPNKTERAFEFPLATAEWANGLFSGEAIERVQIMATDSDHGRGQELAEEEYQALPEPSKGVVEYYRREASGREILVGKEEYQGIAEERRGSIRYYRKEIPRLAEIEVWTAGDNINLGATERGGQATIETNGPLKDLGSTVSDGRYNTGHNGSVFGYRPYSFIEDLGALFWVDTMHFILDGSTLIDELMVDISDGTRAPDGTIRWQRVVRSTEREEGHPMKYREFRIEPAKVRYIRAPFQNPLIALSYIAFIEVMAYGQGYVPDVAVTSDLIELGGRKNLISIEWEADAPPGTTTQLQTRTGNELKETKIYHDSNGNIVTQQKYDGLPKSKKGEIETFHEPGSDWSTWSAPYAVSGEDIKSPSPREYMLIRARLLADRPDIAASLRSIRVNMSDPVADRLVGEVWPDRITEVGRPEDLALFIRPTLSSTRQGFDEIMVEATAGTAMELLAARTGTDADFRSGQPKTYAPSDLVIMPASADTVWFRLPEPVKRGVDLVEVEFRSTVYSNSASFRTSAQDSRAPGFWQRVDAGDATDLAGSQTTTVLALEGSQVIGDFGVEPMVITPNGDGVNDDMSFGFSVARLNADRAVTLRIYDLSGALVKEIAERRTDPRGRYGMRWSGVDDQGQVVPPGIYLARLQADVDSGSATGTSAERLVYVAY